MDGGTSACYNEFRARCGSRGLREQVYKLDGGRCAECGLDAHALFQLLRATGSDTSKDTTIAARRAVLRSFPGAERAFGDPEAHGVLRLLLEHPKAGHAWHVDHIKRVVDGGGEASVLECQTLCAACHLRKTKVERAADARARRRIKEGLVKERTKRRRRQQDSDGCYDSDFE